MRTRITKRNLPLGSVYRFLEPGPGVLLTTSTRAGRSNVIPMSWHTTMEFTPPLLGCVVSDRNYSFQALKGTKEGVLNIPTVALIEAAVACGNTPGRSVDKFAAFGLTPLPARLETFHHLGQGDFMIAGRRRVLASRAK